MPAPRQSSKLLRKLNPQKINRNHKRMNNQPRLVEELAIALLNKRGFFVHELNCRLIKEGFAPEVVNTCVEKLSSKKFVSDNQAYAELQMYVDSHPECTPTSLRPKLVKRELSQEFIEELNSKLFDINNQYSRALAAVQRKYKPDAPVGKIYRYLVSHGFSLDVSESVAESWNTATE